jgi:AcrR family transcriptional regulator
MLRRERVDRSIERIVRVSLSLGTSSGAVLPSSVSVAGTRGRLLRAGLELLFERGYHGTSIRDIAEGAGVQSATLYGHFASKEELLAELVVLGHEEHHRRLVDALMDAGSDPRDQLRALVSAHVAGHAEFAMLAIVANAELSRLGAEAAAPAHVLRGRSLELLMTVVSRGVRQGVFVIEHPEITINAIATMGSSVALWYPPVADHLDVDVVRETLSDLALRLVLAPTSS